MHWLCVLLNLEQKTSTYLETNLVSVDHSAASDRDMLESDGDGAVEHRNEQPVKTSADWLFCIQRRGSAVRKLMSVMIGISAILLLYFIISPALTSPRTAQVLTCTLLNL